MELLWLRFCPCLWGEPHFLPQAKTVLGRGVQETAQWEEDWSVVPAPLPGGSYHWPLRLQGSDALLDSAGSALSMHITIVRYTQFK